MKDHTTNPNVRATITELLLRGLRAIGDKIFQADDCRANEQDWQIIRRHGGLSRGYRDLRFDRLLTCKACNGRGCDLAEVTCPICDGAGRIVLDPAEASEPGRSQP